MIFSTVKFHNLKKVLSLLCWTLGMVWALSAENFKRDILSIVDDHEEEFFSHEALDMVFHRLGLNVVHHLSSKKLPPDAKNFRAVLVWSQNSDLYNAETVLNFLNKAIDDGVKVILLGHLPGQIERRSGNPTGEAYIELLKRCGLKSGRYTLKNPIFLKAEVKDPSMINFEHQFTYRGRFFSQLESTDSSHHIPLSIHEKTPAKRRSELIVIGKFGGIALQPAIYHNKPNSSLKRWVLNPFVFIQKALELPHDYPIPDVTTWNGKRAIYCHIDGDAFTGTCRYDKKRTVTEVLYEDVIKPFRFPHTFSLVHVWFDPTVKELTIDTIEEGKIIDQTRVNIHPKQQEKWKKIARKIFEEGWVEAGLHGYSHPLKWVQRKNALNVPNRPFSLHDEFNRSQEIFSEIMGGREALIFQWTGDCKPGEDALAHLEDMNLLNINGGDTLYDDTYDSLMHVAPLYRRVGRQIQVYTSASNENIYTNEWQGPYYGFRNVIQTFIRTETPIRLAPVNVYYHWYTGEMAASVRALQEVFEWCDQQPLVPIKTTEYVKSVHGFISSQWQRTEQGWHLQNRSNLRTFRFESWPDGMVPKVSKEHKVLGYQIIDDPQVQKRLYVHLSEAEDASIEWTSQKDQTHLLEATAIVHQWNYDQNVLNIQLWGWRPSTLVFENLPQQPLPQKGVSVRQDGQRTIIELTPKGDTLLSLSCPKN